MIKLLFNKINNMSKGTLIASSIILIFLIGVLDYLTGYEVSLSILYLLPVTTVSWFVSRRNALALSALGAVVWLVADFLSGHPYSHSAIPFWNATVRMGFFLIVAYAVSVIKDMLDREKILARIDFLTGLYNNRHFFETLANEMNRTKRFGHPFSLAYIDIDNFKQVNDTLGHGAGDKLLRDVANTMKEHIRLIDTVARLGGDEFAIVMPGTGGDNAVAGMNKILGHLRDMVGANNWPVTFSIGVVACYEACDLDDLLKKADDLMYSVKASGKNKVESAVYV